ncbi:UNVERIFIED_CONTAM: hypothetical protein K2H54_061287 [Gekko kuhli]
MPGLESGNCLQCKAGVLSPPSYNSCCGACCSLGIFYIVKHSKMMCPVDKSVSPQEPATLSGFWYRLRFYLGPIKLNTSPLTFTEQRMGSHYTCLVFLVSLLAQKLCSLWMKESVFLAYVRAHSRKRP